MREVCQKNMANEKQCMGGLAAHAVGLQKLSEESGLTLCETDWAPNELLVLGATFTYYDINFSYINKRWVKKNSPKMAATQGQQIPGTDSGNTKAVYLMMLCIHKKFNALYSLFVDKNLEFIAYLCNSNNSYPMDKEIY